jgi:integration host factor subunit beta
MPAKKFTKADIIDSLYEKTGMNRNEIRSTVDLLIDELKGAIMRREIIELRGFGTFEVKVRKARPRARNPRTGESIVIRSHGVVAFRSGRELKQAVWNITDGDNKPEEK